MSCNKYRKVNGKLKFQQKLLKKKGRKSIDNFLRNFCLNSGLTEPLKMCRIQRLTIGKRK